ncbi:MAG: efflux RND transporter periplasmic adaptor subunit, partial [Betaproteobacteria bacterium]|nr:efflux RND transporter periplasmic adaptor subunit [Betaproteobacteria bacterium]
MASRVLYPIVAVVGIAAASGAAWWYQNRPVSSPATAADSAAGKANAPAASAPAPTGAASSGGPGPAATPGGGPARPATVEVAKVETTTITDDAQSVGNLRSRQGVMVRPEVSGRVTQLNFRDGDRVRKGDVLVQLDDQLPLAQIKQAEAELSIARANHKRNQELVAQNFISQRSVDESAAGLEVAQAKLALAQATAARLKVVAPFDGLTGIRLVNPGDYVRDGTDIVNIEDIEVMFVDFRLPERFQTKIRRGQQASVELDALPGRKFSALVQAIDPLIDANGRSVGIRACIDNRQLQLRPGMFARVTTVFGVRERAAVVPEEAIVPQGNRLFVVKVVEGPEKDTKVSQRVEVKTGVRRPGRVEILDGVQEGDVLVVAGHQRLQRDGSIVKVLELNRPQGGGGPGGAQAGGPPGAAGAPGAANAGGRPGGAKPPAGKPPAAKGPEGPNPCLAMMG